MSVRQALLALLRQEPRYGYQLRSEFERRTGGSWPLNIGQVYTTLNRLERDGMVEPVHGPDDGSGQLIYQTTEAGARETADWFHTPVLRSAPTRDELAIKLAMAVTLPGVDVGSVIQRQRTATMSALQDFTRLKRQAASATPDDLAWSLVLDRLIFEAEAEIRWLDHCEARVRRAAVERAAEPSTGQTSVPTADKPNREVAR